MYTLKSKMHKNDMNDDSRFECLASKTLLRKNSSNVILFIKVIPVRKTMYPKGNGESIEQLGFRR